MFRQLISLDEAKRRIEKAFSPKPPKTEEIPLLKAVGRVLASDIAAPMDVPPFSRSTVDGYAVRAEDTFGADEDKPVMLKISGYADVGEISKLRLEKNYAMKIVTGAPLPSNSNAAVMIEHTNEENEKVYVYKSVVKNENMMGKGSDIRKDAMVLKGGTILSSQNLGVLAALGFAQVKVYKKPKVAVISTGQEIIAPGNPLPLGKIYDINAYTLTAALLEIGVEPINFDIIQDDNVEVLKSTLENALDISEVVITSGGVSVGPKDILPNIIDGLGEPGLIIHGIAIKPGKPIAVAVVGEKLIFSLPGHPTSALLTYQLLIRPFLPLLTKQKALPSTTLRAVITDKVFSARGRRTFITVTLSQNDAGHWLASPVLEGLSGAITTLAKADGYIELEETQQFVESGEEVDVLLFKPVEDIGRLS
ncbi:MAG: molybdopterin molybdotransferase MoeA [Candidatus Bathyarchaeota archaeon]|nr:MAG: molybdopterin molybdotransferase MoeA [Candidatus Bathyarchaeota archaeon]